MTKKPIEISMIIVMSIGVVSHTVWAKAVYDGAGKIEVSGKGNTLAGVAEDIADAKVFSYDPAARTATCGALDVSIIKGGELTIGIKDHKDKGETLIFKCEATQGLTKKSMKQDRDKYGFIAERGGALSIYHSKIEAANGLIDFRTARHSGISYAPLSKGEIVDSIFKSMKCLDIQSSIRVDGVVCENCVYGVYLRDGTSIKGFKTRNAKHAAFIRPNKGDQVKFISCSLESSGEVIRCLRSERNQKSPILIEFVDCELPEDPGKRISIVGNNIGVALLHTIKVSLIDENKAPIPGEQLSLRSNSIGAPELGPVTVVTDNTGSTWLPVPEYADYSLNAEKSGTGQHTVYTSRLSTGDGQVLKEDWTPMKQAALIFAKTAAGFSESEGEYTAGKATSIRNLIPNSSFEISTYPGFPDCWWPRNWIQLTEDGKGKVHPDDALTFLGLDSKNPYHGKQCLRLGTNIGRGIWKRPYWNPGGKTYTISAYMRSDIPGTKASVAFRRMEPWTSELTGEWKRYHFTASFKRDFLFILNNNGPGDVYVDAIQMEEGSELHPYVRDNYRPFVY